MTDIATDGTEPYIGYNTGLAAADVNVAQAVNDRGERDRALHERDRARAELAHKGEQLEAALAEGNELGRKLKQLTSEYDAGLKRQHEIAQDLRSRLDYAEVRLATAPAGTFSEPQALDRIAPSAQQRQDAEQEHRDRDKSATADQDSALQAAEAEKALKADQEREDIAMREVRQADGLHVPEPEPKKKRLRW
jgi:hypothetical protein